MSNFWQRAITAVLFVIILLCAVLFDDRAFIGLFFGISVFCLLEFYGLVERGGYQPNLFFGMGAGIFIYTLVTFYLYERLSPAYFTLIIPLTSLLFVAELYRKKDKPFSNIGLSFLGLIYIIAPFCLFVSTGFIFGNFYSYVFPLGILLLIWANDTGAYVFGMLFGKRRLFERISPKKSWEGFFGGMFIALNVSVLLYRYLGQINLVEWLGLAAIVVVVGTLGDLAESLFKRSIDAKDSGDFLPGHGGLLDRFDSLLFASPFIFAYLILIQL